MMISFFQCVVNRPVRAFILPMVALNGFWLEVRSVGSDVLLCQIYKRDVMNDGSVVRPVRF